MLMLKVADSTATLLGRILAVLALAAGMTCPAEGESVTGTDWIVHYNLPDQNYSSEAPGEFSIRNGLVARINALQSGQTGILAAFTFSANTTAGIILTNMQAALNRGAKIFFIADKGISTSSNYYNYSLQQLANRAVNPLVLVQAGTTTTGIMHHKFGLFHYSRTNRVVFTGSWNFTTGASYSQWNIAIEILNQDAIFNAYAQEAAELLAGRFHYDPAKSHAYYGTKFRLADAWGDCWVDFAPYPDASTGGTNALTDIVRTIQSAREEVVFALNKLTRPLVCDALIEAANRGVRINGVIPYSDWNSASDESYAVYYYLLTNRYATTNIVHMITPYSRADYSTLDTGQTDLVHEKWMVIDPWGDAPLLILGSANWTASALNYTDANDENVLFLRHRDLARWFYVQFKRMTRLWPESNHNWCSLALRQHQVCATAWIADTNRCRFEYAGNFRTNTWTAWDPGFQNNIGGIFRLAPDSYRAMYFRIHRY